MTASLPPNLPPVLPSVASLPRFEVRLSPPNLDDWRPGNRGVPGFLRFESGQPGPNLLITALMHGNEIAGAIALDELLRGCPRPVRGTLTAGFLNLAAFDRFDSTQPTTSRFVDEDMNRLWDADILDGPRVSIELTRARQIRPIIDAADILLDLHSMLWPSEPLILSGPTIKGRTLARAIGTPPMAVADRGHSNGPRLIDYAGFAEETDPRIACLVEAGPHWEPATVDTARTAIAALLRQTGLIDAALSQSSDPTPPPAWRCAEVTQAITANTSGFSFVRDFRGGDIIAERDTLIATDAGREIRTPHENCLLVMPSLRPSRGHTAVRLARFLDE